METGLLDELNEAQKEAVLQTEGPVMVMAGAGSGKTKVLTHRIAYLLLEKQVPLDAILAVTFTNKAAAEMKQRVQNLVGENTMWMWISTFHSFCARFLRREIHLLPPYTSNFGILDEEDSLKVVKDIVKEEQIDDFKPKTFRNLISKVKNFPQYKSSNLPLWNRYLRVSQRYQQRLAESNLLDFDDLLVKTLDILKKDPMVLNHYQNKRSSKCFRGGRRLSIHLFFSGSQHQKYRIVSKRFSEVPSGEVGTKLSVDNANFRRCERIDSEKSEPDSQDIVFFEYSRSIAVLLCCR